MAKAKKKRSTKKKTSTKTKQKTSIHHPYDSITKMVLSDTKEATSFFKSYLPESITSKIDWKTLKLQNASFIDSEFKKSEADLLYLANLKGSKKKDFPVYLI